MLLQGDCTSEPPGLAQPLRVARQCFLTVATGFLELDSRGDLLLSLLRIAFSPPGPPAAMPAAQEPQAVLTVRAGAAWLANMELLGDDGNSRGIDVLAGQRLFAFGASL